jgi:glucan phosphoethanolaminetransferase (alkaline phosphatase superfamily)
MTAVQKQVLSEIHSGKLRMKSRYYFWLLWCLGAVATILAAALAAYVFSIISFIVRIQTADTPAYGARQNLSQSIATFPWWLLVVTGLLMALALWLNKRYTRLYRYRTSLLIGIFLTLSLLIGAIVSYSGLGHLENYEHRPVQNTQHPGRGSVRHR